jgi:hypothetical protein
MQTIKQNIKKYPKKIINLLTDSQAEDECLMVAN